MIKKVLLLAALVLALPFAAFAGSSVDFTNSGGTLSGTNSGLTLTGSTLIAANGLGGGLITGSNLGTVSFSTGMLNGGTLQMGATFAAGGAFSITGNGTGGVPNGVIFNGLVHGTGNLDFNNSGERDPQLHTDWFSDRNLVRRRHCQWRDRPVDHQHRSWFFQRAGYRFER